MLVSIVTPVLNGARFLEETILSVLEQDYPHIEYIIVDGGSTDDTLDIIHKYEDRLASWISEPDQGQADAINKGFARASGEIFAWLNADDLYLPGAISEAAAFLHEHHVGMVYGDVNYINEHGETIGSFLSKQTDYDRLMNGYVNIPQQAAFFRAHLFKQIGAMDICYDFAMDYYLWVSLAKITPIIYHRQLWANFRLHELSKTLTHEKRCWPEMLLIYFKEGGEGNTRMVRRALLRTYLWERIPFWRRFYFRQRFPWLPF